MEVLVFKTSISKRTQIDKVKTLLKAIPAIHKWTFDLEDCDKVLRIVADDLSARQIESVLQTAGFGCQELEQLANPSLSGLLVNTEEGA